MVSTDLPALSPAARLQPAFPPAERTLPFAMPESLRIPMPQIKEPGQLPPFLLLGERHDASFARTERGFEVDYVWPAFARGPVLQLSVTGSTANIKELWCGQFLCHSFGSGDSLARGLLYHIGVTLANRDCPQHRPDGEQKLNRIDPREEFFRQLFHERLGIDWCLPATGVRHRVSEPEGILRALVVPCKPDEGDRLAQLVQGYREQPGVYAVDGCPRLRHGHFSRRQVTVTRAGHGGTLHETECRLFVGAWRAVVELALFLADNGWNLAAGLFPAFVACPYELVRPYRSRPAGDGDETVEAIYPPLLPPQEGLGVVDGFIPAPLGDLTPYRSGGSVELSRSLRAAVDAAFPLDGDASLFAMANPGAPRIWLHRSSDPAKPALPVLCVLCNSQDDPLRKIYDIVYDGSARRLPLAYEVKAGDDSFMIVPNLSERTYCLDAEGFLYLLPEVVRRLEEKLHTAWLVEDYAMEGILGDRELASCVTAGPRVEGW